MKDFLRKIAPFEEVELEAIMQLGTEKKAKVGEKMFLADRPFTRLWFIKSGMLRAYRIMEGQDYTFFFFTRQDFAVDYQSFLTEKESPLLFEALADTEYLEFSKQQILGLYDRFPRFERLGRIMAERAYLSATERLKQFQAESLETRYQRLLDKDPELFLQIPQYHIASYLGVKPQSLSRLRARLAGKNY